MSSELEGGKVLVVGDDLQNIGRVVSFVSHHKPVSIAAELENNLWNLKNQVEDLQTTALEDHQIGHVIKRLEVIAETIDRAGKISKSLTADVVLPPAEDLRVKLVPSDSLDRLEEYRTDEAKAFLLVGTFFGAVLGILSNWVTDGAFTITRASGVFLGFLGSMALLSSAWAFQISRRAEKLRKRLFGESTASKEKKALEDKERAKT